jgi:hypothetical protein
MGTVGLGEQNSYGHIQVVEIHIETHVRTYTQHSDGDASSVQCMQNLSYLELEVLLAAVQQKRCTVQVCAECI